MEVMASTIPEQAAVSSENGNDQSRNLKQQNPLSSQASQSRPQSLRRSRSISFAGSDPPAPSTSAYERFHPQETEQHPYENAGANVQDHDRDYQSSTPGNPTAAAADPPSDPSSPNPFPEDLKAPWYSRLASNYRSISLENKGSTARDHLALERTFLAWLRTSLAFASIGIAITQLFRLNTSLADQNQQMQWILRHWNSKNPDMLSKALPLSPLMGASLTPDIYTHIRSAFLLDQQQQEQQQAQQLNPLVTFASSPDNHNDPNTLLDHLIQPTESNSHAAARLRHLGKPLGATFLGISIVVLFIGFHRYFESQHWIIRGKFPASRGSVALTGLITIALIIASLVVVLAVAPAAYSR